MYRNVYFGLLKIQLYSLKYSTYCSFEAPSTAVVNNTVLYSLFIIDENKQQLDYQEHKTLFRLVCHICLMIPWAHLQCSCLVVQKHYMQYTHVAVISKHFVAVLQNSCGFSMRSVISEQTLGLYGSNLADQPFLHCTSYRKSRHRRYNWSQNLVSFSSKLAVI